MSNNQAITFEQVEQKRRAFSKALKEFAAAKGRYHNPAPQLPAEKLADCQILPNRMVLLDKVAKGGVIAEIGVDTGNFSQEILQRCQPSELHLFDIDASRVQNKITLAALNDANNRAKLHVGDSSTSMSALPDGTFDIIYIDADHKYEGVVKDIEASLPKLKPDGAFIFNDYAVWSPTSMFHCGVARAVHELCLRKPWKFRYLALQTMMYNDVMLVRD